MKAQKRHHTATHKRSPRLDPASGGEEYDLCINGAGPIGATLGCLLAQEGLRILLLEQKPLITEPDSTLDGRAYALTEGVRPLLEKAGIWANLPRPAQKIAQIHVVDSAELARPFPFSLNSLLTFPQPIHSGPIHSGQTYSELDFTQDDAPEGRPFGWMVEASDLLAACARTLVQQSGMTILSPRDGAEKSEFSSHFSFEPDYVSITCTLQHGDTKEQEQHQARVPLIIAADGRRSRLREQAGIPLTRIPYHKSAFVTVLVHEHPHHGTALEHFLPQGPFARLPLPASATHPHRSAIVITDQPHRINHLMSMPEQALTHYIAERMRGTALGRISCTEKRWCYPLSSQYAHDYQAERLALVGDAAHGLHPVAGQGMNVGFRDVHYLTQILAQAFKNNEDLGRPDLLRHYQQVTRPYNMSMLGGCDIMERIFSNRNPILGALRRAGLAALTRSPALRHRFVRKAMGLQHDQS